MSDAACKQAMCAGWPMPIPDVAGKWSRPGAKKRADEERAVRRVLNSTAFTDVADAHKDSDIRKAMIEAIGKTPMIQEQIETAQAYIHELGDG